MRGGGVHVCVSKPKTTDDRSPEVDGSVLGRIYAGDRVDYSLD